MVATRKKTAQKTPASTELTADQVRATYQASVAACEEKLKAKDLYIASLGNEISHLRAVNAGLAGQQEDQIPGTQELYQIREKIRLLEDELKAKQNQGLIATFGKDQIDQLHTLARRVDYYEQTQQELATRAAHISELKHERDGTQHGSASTPTSPAKSLTQIQTIGYRQPDGLAEIERLMANDPSLILVDIRYQPKSRKPEWSGRAFAEKYQERYRWIEALGNLNYKTPGNIQLADPQAGIEQLQVLLHEGHHILLLCGCECYDTCHRKVVFDLLQTQLTQPSHLIPTSPAYTAGMDDDISDAELQSYAQQYQPASEGEQLKDARQSIRNLLERIADLEQRPDAVWEERYAGLEERFRQQQAVNSAKLGEYAGECANLRKLLAVKDASLESASKFMTEQADARREELAKQYQDLRQALDRATQHACDWQEKARQADKEIEHLRGELEGKSSTKLHTQEPDSTHRQIAQNFAARLYFSFHNGEITLERDGITYSLIGGNLDNSKAIVKLYDPLPGVLSMSIRAKQYETLDLTPDEITHLQTFCYRQLCRMFANEQPASAVQDEQQATPRTRQQNSGPEDRDELREAWLKATRENAHLNKLVEGQSAKKLRARIKELEQYEAMFACKVYADRPTIDSTEATLMLENQHQLGQIADLEQTLLEHDATYLQAAKRMEARTSELEQEIVTLGAQLHGYGEEAANRISELEHHANELEADRDQAAAIAEDLTGQYRTLETENSDLRRENADLRELSEHQADEFAEATKKLAEASRKLARAETSIDCSACEIKDQEIYRLKGQHDDDAAILNRHYTFFAWLRELWANKHIESNRKVAEVALRLWLIFGHQDQHGYADIVVEEFANTCGFSRQTGSRMIKETVNTGTHGLIIDLIERTVPDKNREGHKRTIQQKHYRLAPTRMADLADQLHKEDDNAKQGGAGLYCKKCNRQGTLRRIYHTICINGECLHEVIRMPEDIEEMKKRGPAVEAEDAPRAVAEVERIMQATAPAREVAPDPASAVEVQTIDVQLEQESAAAFQAASDMEGEIMAAARSQNHPALTLPQVGVQIRAGSSNWSQWMWMSHPTDQQIHAVHSSLLCGQAATLDICQSQDEPTQTAAPTPWVWTEEDSARLTADTWTEIERKDPGCYVPADIIDYWATQGRAYTPTKPRVEPEITPSLPEATPMHTHKAVDLRTGRIVEVNE